MANYTENLRRIMREANDFSVVVEIYHQNAAPSADGFNPNDAVKRFATTNDLDGTTGGVGFFGANYTRLVKKFGSIRQTITAEVNSASVEFDNLTREISEFEFGTGFEGLIKVIRLISRSQSILLSDSKILFVGRCEKPTSGTRQSLSLSAKHILGSTDGVLPRRKFAPDDAEGRAPSDPLFEGFRFMPQYGNVSHQTREKRGGFLGLLGFKKTVTNTVPWSSYSDLDAEKYVPEVFGRTQVIGTHIGYVDKGAFLQTVTAFCEGEIVGFQNPRSVSPGLNLFPVFGALRGLLGGVGDQLPDLNWVAPGFYSRLAHLRCSIHGSKVAEADPAPDIVAIVIGKKIIIPDGAGNWTYSSWSDDAAAQTRFLLTSPDYYKLDPAWIDDASFLESYLFNNQIIFDQSQSDVIFVPDAPLYKDPIEPGATPPAMAPFLSSTGLCTAEYFKFLAGTLGIGKTFNLQPKHYFYDAANKNPIEPDLDPNGDDGGGGTGTTTTSPGLVFNLRRRYTSNVIVTEQIKLTDFLHDILFPSSRLFFTQSANGKIKLNSKKPVDWALAQTAVAGSSVTIDDVSPWINNRSGYLLIDPNTNQSEVRKVAAANYSAAQNSTAISASSNIGVSAFTGGNGANLAAQATLTINTRENTNSVLIDGIGIDFNAGDTDTTATIAGFLHGSINAHPILQRRFSAAWTPGAPQVVVRAKFGSLTLDSNLELNHGAPLANPTIAPTCIAASGGTLAAGVYRVAYAYANARGQTMLSPARPITLSANQKINVSAVAPPAGADLVWYCSPAENSSKIRFVIRNSGAAFTISALPRLSGALPPDLNRTGAEVLRVAAIFSDRAETRSNAARSNVLKATYEWQLGNREKSVNRVDLKFRDSTQDYRLIELRLRDDAHIDKTKRVSNKVLNGQAIDNYDQAYRISSGLLAELRDADFFYKWASDREAMLLEEGEVVCITDDGAQVYNLPVRIESINYAIEKNFPKVSFVARKYSTTLYDDSVCERTIPVVVESSQAIDPNSYLARTENYTVTATDYTVDCQGDNDFTVTLLPAAVLRWKVYNIKNSGAATITLATQNAEVIDAALTQKIAPKESLQVQSTGAYWIII